MNRCCLLEERESFANTSEFRFPLFLKVVATRLLKCAYLRRFGWLSLSAVGSVYPIPDVFWLRLVRIVPNTTETQVVKLPNSQLNLVPKKQCIHKFPRVAVDLHLDICCCPC